MECELQLEIFLTCSAAWWSLRGALRDRQVTQVCEVFLPKDTTSASISLIKELRSSNMSKSPKSNTLRTCEAIGLLASTPFSGRMLLLQIQCCAEKGRKEDGYSVIFDVCCLGFKVDLFFLRKE